MKHLALIVGLALLWGCSSTDEDEPGGGGTGGTAGTGGTGGNQTSSTGGVGGGGCGAEQYECATGCCDCPAVGQVAEIDFGVAVTHVAGADLDADSRLDVVLALAGGGLMTLSGNTCGALVPMSSVTDVVATGLDVGMLDAEPGWEVVVQTAERVLEARSGTDLRLLWSEDVSSLSSAGEVMAAHLDTDGDHDAAAFDAQHANLLRMENTGSDWLMRAAMSLPAGIERTAAGDLGDNARDELLFLGQGLVEVVSAGDFDFSDVRPLSAQPHAAADIADIDGDGLTDAAVCSRVNVELWKGDGSTVIAQAGSATLGTTVIDLAAADLDGNGVAEVVALGQDGTLTVLSGGSLTVGGSQPTGPDVFRVLGGDVDGDGRDDVVAIGTDGKAFIWRQGTGSRRGPG